MFSSALTAGRHTLFITAKYGHLHSEGLKDLGCPIQSLDLSPCSAIELNQFSLLTALMLISVAYKFMSVVATTVVTVLMLNL